MKMKCEKVERKITVVNDCAYVMSDLLPYLSDFNIDIILRSRGFWAKTFGLLWKISQINSCSLIHVNYALQDAFLVCKLKHLDILECHGTDMRETLNTRKYGWIVKSALKRARRVLYSTPDLENSVKTFRPDATILPTPVRKEFLDQKVEWIEKLRAVAFQLGYEEFPAELYRYCQLYNIELQVAERNIPYQDMPSFLSSYNIFIDRMTIPSFSKTCLEAMGAGLATVDHRHANTLLDRISELADPTKAMQVGKENKQNVKTEHHVETVAEKLRKIYCEELE